MNQGKQAVSAVLFERVSEVREWVQSERSTGRTIGFVPTMGALHAGHASLIEQAAAACDRVVVSVFVNPTQFNDQGDYSGYPLTPEADVALVEASGGDAVFMPGVQEIYAGLPRVEAVDYGLITSGWEAADRPGHFDGVVAIVDRLFEAVGPNRTYFGEKDLQQLAVVRAMARQRHPGVEVVGCPLVRDADGLALSSRNVRLSQGERAQALAVPQVLHRLREALQAGEGPDEAVGRARVELAGAEGVELAYLDLVQRDTFMPWKQGANGPFFAVAAVRVGGVRLLDNLEVLP